MKNKTKITALLLLCALFILSCLLTACSSGSELTEITSVEIKKDKETVQLKASLSEEYLAEHPDDRIYLLALDSADTDSLSSFEVVGNSKPKGNLSFKFELNGEDGSLLSSFFVLARLISGDMENGEYASITKPAFIENPEIFSQNSTKPQGDSFKGLASEDIYESSLLGASSILLEVNADELLLSDYQDGAINYFYGGRSYYFDGEAVADLDQKISDATALGMRVYLRTVLRQPERDKYGDFTKETISALYYSGAASGKMGYLPNLNGDGIGYIKAFYDFLGSRYGTKNGEFGKVFDYIIGENANDFSQSLNAGSATPERILTQYYSWVKIADSILRSYTKNAKVYISVDHRMRNEDVSGGVGSEAFLEGFAAISPLSSGWNFGVALNMGSGEDISDLLSGEATSLTKIGARNLSDMISLLDSDNLKPSSGKRSVIIDALSLPHTMSEKNRATYYTYAYYKAAELEFDAFIYSADSSDCSLKNASGQKSELYYSYLMCGSDITDQLGGYTARIPEAAIPIFKDYVARELTYEQNVKIELSESIGRIKKSFPCALESFASAGSAINADIDYVSDGDLEIQTLTLHGDVSSVSSAITCFDIPAKNLIESGYIGITMSSSSSVKVALIITDESSFAAYVGEANVSDIPEIYFFNITPFTEDIKSSDTLTVSICVLPAEQVESVELSVSEMALYGSSGNGNSTIISILIVIAVTLGVCGLLYLLTRRRKKRHRNRRYDSHHDSDNDSHDDSHQEQSSEE